MKTIELITFKGCQSAIDFRNEVEQIKSINGEVIQTEMIVVPSIRRAKEMGLYGSPTILVDGQEYQQERRGPSGFY
jgi:hypothetical protein